VLRRTLLSTFNALGTKKYKMKIFGVILLTFVNCYYGMPQEATVGASGFGVSASVDGPPAAFSQIKVAVDGFKSVGDALKEISDKEGLLKELVNTGKTSSFFKNLNAFTGILGNSFAGANFFTDLAFGSFETRMFNRVFKEFENLNDEIKSLRAFAKRGFNQVIGSIWEAQRINPLAKLDSAIDNYNNYMKNPESTSLQKKLIDEFNSEDIRDSVHSIRRAIPNFSQTNFVNEGKCQELLLEKGNLVSTFSRAYLAYNTGCALNNKVNNNMNKEEATSDCRDHVLPNLKTEIFDVIDKKIQECRAVTNAERIAKDFLKREIRDYDTISSAKRKINTFLEDKFPYLTWLAVVYEPLGGFDNHITNADITEFRLYNNMNIALGIMDSCRNYPNCKQDRSECPIVPSSPTRRRCVEFDGNSDLSGGFVGEECFDEKVTWDAEDFYNAAKESLRRKGNYRLTVFRDNKNDDWATASDENQNNNVCTTKLNQRGDFVNDYRIAYIYNL